MDDFRKEWSDDLTNFVNPEFTRFKKAFVFSRKQVEAGRAVVMIGRPSHTLTLYRIRRLPILSVHAE